MGEASGLRDLSLRNLGLLASLTAAMMVSIRLLAVSHGSLTTAFAILGDADVSTVLLGTLLGFVAIGPPMLALGLGVLWPQVSSASSPQMAWFLLVLAAGATLLLSPLALALLMAPAAMAVGFLSRHDPSHRRPYTWSWMILTLVASAMISPPWWPQERAVIAGRRTTVWVVHSDAASVTVLDTDRRIARISASSVSDRHFCESRNDLFGRSLAATLFAPRYPSCS